MIIRSKRQEGDRVEARRDRPSARSSLRQCAVTVCCVALALSPGTLAERQQFAACVGSIADSIAGPGRKNVAVVDFTDLQGNATELGRTWAEEISLALASLGRGFKVIDRTHLKAILQEHRLSATGLMDDQTVKRLGQFVGVDALVTGSITPLGDSMRLLAKVLDTKTAQLIAPCTVELPRTEAVDRLHARLISNESKAPPPVGPRWYVYRDSDAPDNHGFWTNYLVDPRIEEKRVRQIINRIMNPSLVERARPVEPATWVKVDVSLQDEFQWVGLAVASQENYWGDTPGPGFDLSAARKLVFRARGQEGGESIQVKVAICGDKKYGDSARIPAATEWITLTPNWRSYELDLKGTDLRRVITLFAFVADKAHNPQGALTFYLDEIYFDMGR